MRDFPRVRRTMLFTPGSASARLGKLASTDADAVVFDLEDGVAAGAKASARHNVFNWLTSSGSRSKERIVRVNRLGSEDCQFDLAALPYGHFDTLMVPKVETVEDVGMIQAQLAHKEMQAGVAAGSIELILSLETPRGVLNASAIADASKRCSALFFGAGDYVASLGGTSPRLHLEPTAILWARSMIVAAAAAAGCDAIDTPFFDIRNVDGTYADAVVSRNLGFSGKGVFHPIQIEPVHRAMTPAPEVVLHAQRVIASLKEMAERGEGVGMVDGEFVAVDLLPRMERILKVDAHAKQHAASHPNFESPKL